MSKAIHGTTSEYEQALQAELTRTKQRLEQTRHALKILRNETRGTLKAHELAIRYDSGNSNWTCLEMALEQAEKALAEIQADGEAE